MALQISPLILAVVCGLTAAIHMVQVRQFGRVRGVSRSMIWFGLGGTYVYIALASNVAQASGDYSRALVRAFLFVMALADWGDYFVRVREARRMARWDVVR